MGSISTSTSTRERMEAAVTVAQQKYISSNPISKKSYDEACQYLPGGNTRTVLHTNPFPLTFVSGESCHLTTADGHKLIDFLGEYTAGIYGHNHPVIRKAVESALDRGWNYGGHSGLEQRLASLVCERFPAMEQIRFVNSGTEANMMALATAVAVTKKKTILVFNKGYHGSTISVRTSSSKPSLNLPHNFVVGNYNDIASTTALVDSLPKDSLAAILVEPMLGSGGCFTGTPQFLSQLRELASQHAALLIFDEVMTSRLGPHGLGHALGVTPDLMTLGKWVGGGMSFGAFGGRRDIMQLFDPRAGKLEHPGTFNNNVFSMSAGIAGCTLLNAETLNRLNELGDSMRGEIEGVLKKYGISGSIPDVPITDEQHSGVDVEKFPKMFVKGRGSLMVVHFTGPERELWQALFFHHMLDRGIYLAQRGFLALNIKLDREEVDKFVEGVDAFVVKWKGELRW